MVISTARVAFVTPPRLGTSTSVQRPATSEVKEVTNDGRTRGKERQHIRGSGEDILCFIFVGSIFNILDDVVVI